MKEKETLAWLGTKGEILVRCVISDWLRVNDRDGK